MMSLTEYLKRFGRITKIIAGALGAIPVIGRLSGITSIAPPLNTHYFFIYIFFFLAILAITYSTKDAKLWRRSWATPVALGIIFLIGLVAFFAYIYAFESTVRCIYIESLEETDCVIVGTERSEFSKKEYTNLTDVEMLRQHGYRDTDIRKLWRPASVTRSRVFMAVSYFLMVLSLVEISCIFVLKSYLDEQGLNRKSM